MLTKKDLILKMYIDFSQKSLAETITMWYTSMSIKNLKGILCYDEF